MTSPPRIERETPRGKRRPNPRRAAKHLEFIRLLPCVICGRRPAQAAHVRNGTDGGTGLKPSDRYSLPLCFIHHDAQHATGELTFWAFYRVDPVDCASRLWTVSGQIEAGERIVFRARQAINLRRAIASDRRS